MAMGKVRICLLACFILFTVDSYSQANDSTLDKAFWGRFEDRSLTIINGFLLSDSMEVKIDKVASITTIPASTIKILAKNSKEEYEILQKYSRGRNVIIMKTKNSELETYIYNSVEIDSEKIPIAINDTLVIGTQINGAQYSDIKPHHIKSTTFLNANNATRKYKIPLVFGVIDVILK